MKDNAAKSETEPVIRVRGRTSAGYHVEATNKDAPETDFFITPGDVIIWTCAAGVVAMTVWFFFGVGHLISFVYQSVSGAVDVDKLKQQFKAPVPVQAAPVGANEAAADFVMSEKEKEIQKNFNDQWGGSIDKLMQSTQGLTPVPQKKKEVGTF